MGKNQIHSTVDRLLYATTLVKMTLVITMKASGNGQRQVWLELQYISRTRTGPGPINILQRKFYATLIFKQSDWLLKFVNQSGCLKI